MRRSERKGGGGGLWGGGGERERDRGGVGGEGCLDAYTYTFYILSPSLSQANAREAAVEEERTNLRYASV